MVAHLKDSDLSRLLGKTIVYVYADEKNAHLVFGFSEGGGVYLRRLKNLPDVPGILVLPLTREDLEEWRACPIIDGEIEVTQG